MSERKLTIVVGIDDDAGGSIEYLEREILAKLNSLLFFLSDESATLQ